MEDLEQRIEALEEIVEAIGGSVSGILMALTDDTKMEELKQSMIGVIERCESANSSLN